MKFGVSIPGSLTMPSPREVDAALVADLAKRVEDLGYDYISAADHTFVPDYWKTVIGTTFLDPFAALLWYGAHTTRVKLFLACLVMPYRQPLTTAKTLATIDQLTGGRVVLGVVPGYLEEEFAAFNLPLEDRGRMTEEFVRIMQHVWTSDNAAFVGDHYEFSDLEIRPRCRQEPHIPIWFGGSSKRSIRRAVELGSGWAPLAFEVTPPQYVAAHAGDLRGKALPTSGTTPERLREGLAYAREVADSLGREPDLEVVVYPGRPRSAAAESDASVPYSGRRARVADDEMVEWLNAFAAAGATGFSVHVRDRSVADFVEGLEHFATHVAPQVAG